MRLQESTLTANSDWMKSRIWYGPRRQANRTIDAFLGPVLNGHLREEPHRLMIAAAAMNRQVLFALAEECLVEDSP